MEILWREENWGTRRKTLRARKRTNKLTQLYGIGPESNPGHIGRRQLL